MKEKEIEQFLQEKADEIEIRDFESVWGEVKDKIVVKKKQRRKWKWISIAACFVGVITAGMFILPNVVSNQPDNLEEPEIIFLSEQLSSAAVTENDFYENFNAANINCIDVSNYDVLNYALFYTENQEVKGGTLDFCDNEENPSYFVILHIYDKSVQFPKNLYNDYTLSMETSNGANVQYKLDSYSEEDGLYVYRAKAVFNSTSYLVEYNTFENNPAQFFEELFTKKDL